MTRDGDAKRDLDECVLLLAHGLERFGEFGQCGGGAVALQLGELEGHLRSIER